MGINSENKVWKNGSMIQTVYQSIQTEISSQLIVVGIPAFNEEATIGKVILDSQKYANKVIVCDDGSTDYTAKIAEMMGADVIKHSKNSGYGASVRSLFLRAHELDADILVTLDADGQHEPNEIPSIIKPIVEGTADMVIGSRFVNKQGTKEMPRYRQFGAKIITKMLNGSAKNEITDSQSGFRAYNHFALDQLNFYEDGMGASVEILLKAGKTGLRIAEVPSTCKYNIEETDTSSEHPLTHGMGVLFSLIRLIVEERPLLFLGIPSFICLLAGVAFGVWMLQLYAIQETIETNIALATFGCILIGFFMLSTAITLYAIARISEKFGGK
jgi:glycosyltransferase involved in cell wall biosynthesis